MIIGVPWTGKCKAVRVYRTCYLRSGRYESCIELWTNGKGDSHALPRAASSKEAADLRGLYPMKQKGGRKPRREAIVEEMPLQRLKAISRSAGHESVIHSSFVCLLSPSYPLTLPFRSTGHPPCSNLLFFHSGLTFLSSFSLEAVNSSIRDLFLFLSALPRIEPLNLRKISTPTSHHITSAHHVDLG